MTDYIPTILGALGAIAGGAATQCFTLWRESHSGNKARFRDMQFIGGELIIRLIELRYQCREAGDDNGTPTMVNGQQEDIVTTHVEDFSLGDVQGKWESLPPDLQFRIREIPSRLKEIDRWLERFYEIHYSPPENSEYFGHRYDLYYGIVNSVEELIEILRNICKLPKSDLYP
ncbi:hypothetical protein [Rahnella sp. ChDrAdgB13]|uniref:hypothetical protein n=1 Tax=Rahnella sp. ChDrAdgB13 TaxID=1850581 RepID=UPI001AD87AFB|nr:hypothetical protein [Rahnella sp. ChDrAdgB13]